VCIDNDNDSVTIMPDAQTEEDLINLYSIQNITADEHDSGIPRISFEYSTKHVRDDNEFVIFLKSAEQFSLHSGRGPRADMMIHSPSLYMKYKHIIVINDQFAHLQHKPEINLDEFKKDNSWGIVCLDNVEQLSLRSGDFLHSLYISIENIKSGVSTKYIVIRFIKFMHVIMSNAGKHKLFKYNE
jgi:hypothetical protein